ncbi:hypothetical protein CP532_4039 [Ophiocordyceps camponoti-leonardi (nom. inval.)]|nr:hypothetical protein CP532_4039 [Ophiocordyceps camponoti-leonardi (nom. inval.)]
MTALCHCTDCQKVMMGIRRGVGDYFTDERSPSLLVDGGSFHLQYHRAAGFVPKNAIRGGKKDSELMMKETKTGQVKAWDVTDVNGHANRRFFCPNCGSGLYTELDLLPDYACIKAGSLHGRAAGLDGEVDFELYAQNRVDYLRPCSGARQEAFFDLDSPGIVNLRMKTLKEKEEKEEEKKEVEYAIVDEVDTDTEIAYGFTPDQVADMDFKIWDAELKPEIPRGPETILGC